MKKQDNVIHERGGRRSNAAPCSTSRVVAILKRSGFDYTLISFKKTHEARGEYRIFWCRLDDKISMTQKIADALKTAGVKCSTDAMHSINQAAVYLRLPNR